MSATLMLHPNSWGLKAAVDWGWARMMEGYFVRMCSLPNGAATFIAWPKETARTNAHIKKMPRYAGQYRHVRLGDDLPPDDAA